MKIGTVRSKYCTWSLAIGSIIFAGAIGYQLHSWLPQSFTHTSNRRTIFIAENSIPMGALLYIAYHKAYFLAQGCTVHLIPFSSGRDALDYLLAGNADIATVADTPIIKAAMEHQRFQILATFGSSPTENAIVGWRNHIRAPGDLAGKRVGVAANTTAEYFLNAYLTSVEIPDSSITKVMLDPDETVSALLQRRVDAVSTWNPHIAQLLEIMGDEAISLKGDNIYTFTWNLVSSTEFAADRRAVTAILHSLNLARKFALENPEESKKIAANYVRMNPKTMDTLWKEMQLDVRLDQSLIINLEKQADWYMRKASMDRSELPNFLNHIYLDGLLAENPLKVSIIH